MANFSKNITNSVRCFGGGPSTKWGQANGTPYTMTWGTSKWGEDNSLPIAFVKVISNSQPVTFDYARSNLSKIFGIGSFSPGFEVSSQTLAQAGWYYVFTSDTTNADDRDFAVWTSSTVNDATFTCQTANGTSWSEV